jgi:hypothetical protein
LPHALALRTAEVRTQAQKELATAKAKSEMLAMAKMMVPDSLEVLHATINRSGDKAQILTVATKTMPKGQKMVGANCHPRLNRALQLRRKPQGFRCQSICATCSQSARQSGTSRSGVCRGRRHFLNVHGVRHILTFNGDDFVRYRVDVLTIHLLCLAERHQNGSAERVICSWSACRAWSATPKTWPCEYPQYRLCIADIFRLHVCAGLLVSVL